MGYTRIKSETVAVYHVTARVVHRDRLLGDLEREVWVRSLHAVAEFSGIEVITYACMTNHSHILVRVDPASKGCSDAELVRRFKALYGTTRAMWCKLDASGLAHALSDPANTSGAEQLRERLRARMGDISEFMRTLHQRFTKWYNNVHNTVGTLWAERFNSVLIEDVPWLVALVAAYVDLNPVRAGLATLPGGYRWSGYTEALSGNDQLRGALAACFPREKETAKALAAYRLLMLGKAAAGKRDGSGARINRAQYLEAVRSGGELEVHELLQLKLRFLSQGLALGGEKWLREGSGAKALARLPRPPAPAPLEILDDLDLCVGRSRYRFGGVDLPGA